MYGYEAQSGGTYGGLAAQTPFTDIYFPQVLGQSTSGTTPLIGGAGPSGENILPYTSLADQVSTGPTAGGGMNSSGTAATTSPALQQPHWSTILDFHNSPAPWILLGILLLYGWIHVSVRANGRFMA